MSHNIKLKYKDEYLRNILSNYKNHCNVGLSPEENRPSNLQQNIFKLKDIK